MRILGKRALVIVGSLVVVVLAVGWSNRTFIGLYFGSLDHNIGAPTETAQATVVGSDPDLLARLAVAGDVGTGESEAFATAGAMDVLDQQYPFDALLLLGDNVYSSGDPEQIQAKVLAPFGPVLDGGTQLIGVLGNHDIRDNNGPAHAAALGMPHPWYDVTIGGTHIIALDSNRTGDSDQLAWLERTLAASEADRLIAIMHHPAFSAGWHGNDRGVQANFVPLFEKHGVDLVLSGHDHDYQRNKEIDGVTYIVSGGAAKLRNAGRENFTAISWSTYHFVDLAIYSNRIEGQAIDHSGRAIDSFVVSTS